MNDFKVIARLLTAIRKSEESPVFNTALVSEQALQTTAVNRDILARKLYKDGYIDGLYIIDGVDNVSCPVILWDNSKPEVTLKGLEYMEESSPLRKALKEIEAVGSAVAAAVVTSAITGR